MTEPTKPLRSERSVADILAEAARDDQDGVPVEPFVMVLKNGRKVPFRNPQDISVEEQENAGPGFSGQLRLMCASKSDWRALWAEVRHMPVRRIGAFVEAIVDYYEQAEAGKDGLSST